MIDIDAFAVKKPLVVSGNTKKTRLSDQNNPSKHGFFAPFLQKTQRPFL